MSDHPIILGPSYQLHVGVHGSLIERPPPGIHYLQRRSIVHFDFPLSAERLSPFAEQNIGECVSFMELPDPYAPAHLARTIYAGRGPWVVDADCMLGTLQFGHFYPLGSMASIKGEAIDIGVVLQRQRRVAAALASDHCIAILLRTERARHRFFDQLTLLSNGCGRALAALEKKTHVVRPAVSVSIARDRISERTAVTTSVIYAGRTFHDKGGAMAVSVLTQLRRRYGDRITLTMVGECPAPFHRACDAAAIRRLPTSSRHEFLQLLSAADIFLSPTLFESFGMEILEAAAAGAAVVTAGGPGMEHIGELLRDGQDAVIISNALPLTTRIERYVQAVVDLIDHPDLRARLRANCHELLKFGPLSIARRDQVLLPVYDRLIAESEKMRREPSAIIAPVASTAYRRLSWAEEVCYWEMARRTGNSAVRVRI